MAEESKNSIVISKKNSGFPDYLDFDKLRREGIDYLGKLGGKIWTDHNVHDPGITILEMLCYALLDLGYRTNLPETDIFTRNPEDTSADNNFFTPAQILACNPLTITDFRKLLIDIDGVKNAWLEIATDKEDFCRPPRQIDPASTAATGAGQGRQEKCIDYLNGLYHVYIETEKNIEKEFSTEEEKEKYRAELKAKIIAALMAHRNLCEDFIDIYILCKQEIGVCADIELEENAEPEKAYIAIVEKLRQFFSPAPTFYTLPQLLDKNKPIDEIFAGRPHNATESHGFVDTEEFEKLKLRKEIHLSDVYNALFEVEGIKAVRRLHLRVCKDGTPTAVKGWKFHMPHNHVPEFSITCSGFQFSKQDMPVFVDFKKFEGLFAINFARNGKILYQSPSPYLDLEIPKGIYRSDLGDYYSIQNEFPRVYGIAEGGLPDGATPARKAQALQLKAYLLFFDQLLANYVAQLQHIRSLFALSAPTVGEEQHTYFINQLTSVPELQKLLRFNIKETNNNSLGSEGSLLLIPVDKKKLLKLKEQDQLKNLELGELPLYAFATMADRDIVISQVKNDLYFEQFQCEYVTKTDDCVYYYILTCSDEIALISKKYFAGVSEATAHAASVKYVGNFDENYRSFTTSGNVFSFQIELNLLSFAKYLQLLVEDKELFYRRRQDFLNHLLARFAEKFTDFAQMSFATDGYNQLLNADIKNKEKFLSHYDDLSSNRGRAYDYLANNWNNDNVSGFEKKFKALSGIENWKRHNLCNFVVDEYDNQFAVTLKIAGTNYFQAEDKFESRSEALAAAQLLFAALRKKEHYTAVFIPHDKMYALKINYADKRQAIYPTTQSSEEEAMRVADNLAGLFTEKPPAETVFESTYIYVPVLTNAMGSRVRQSIEVYAADAEARVGVLKTVKRIDDRKKWKYDEGVPALGNLYHDSKLMDALLFINTDAFKIDINNTIVGKPDKFTYDLLDKKNNFKLRSAIEFDNADFARSHAHELLTLLNSEANYRITRNDAYGKWLVQIIYKETIQASSAIESNTQQEAAVLGNTICSIVRDHQYHIVVDKIPHRWKFNYELGYDKTNLHVFHSVEEYSKQEEAVVAAGLFGKALSVLRLAEVNNELLLQPATDKQAINAVKWMPTAGNTNLSLAKAAVEKLLEEQKEIRELSAADNLEAFNRSVNIDEVSRQGLFVYRLVDKNNVPAFYANTFLSKADANNEVKVVAKRFKDGAIYLRLCMGGDIIAERKHPITNITWYRYQLKCVNQVYKSGIQAGQSLILFESAKRYTTREDAEKAFFENYLAIIHEASTAANYGIKISLTEIAIDVEDRLVTTDSIVFIPKVTMEELGASPDIVIHQLINLARTYPIRLTVVGSKEFYQLFPCEKKEERETDKAICKKGKEQYVYYFILGTNIDEAAEWQSVKWFATPAEAQVEFDFFRMLLGYSGNYFVDCDGCQKEKTEYRIYIREVLAESAERFVREEDAWGKYGVQKFICVAQSDDPFQTYLRKGDCCYSFYTACGNGLVVHPCKYDRPEKRDEVLLKLYQLLTDLVKKEAWRVEDTGETFVLHNAGGEPFATMATNRQNNGCAADAVYAIIEYLYKNENYKEENGSIVLTGKTNQRLVQSFQTGFTLEQWKNMLQEFVCYYPIVKPADEKTQRDKYCIEIKLPGFNTCKEDNTEEKPCGCGTEEEENIAPCYIAWKSDCCYNSCAEAEQALQIIIRLLLNYEYYRPVFDCTCGAYGIAIQFSTTEVIINPNITYYWEQANTRNWQNSELVAVNPQCYPSPEEACKAVDRAKQLINSEGLHLVEHILLRPHCNPEDCQCPEYSKRCDDETGCEFIWPVQDEDPCTEEKDICFVPGTDRYSFIATVALPAWPVRFRKQENRRLLENILYHEAPAHVLLRILWLAPHDFCCFESKFKNWNRWLTGKKTCIDDFSVCDFLDFLFDRNYECLDECRVCLPCNEEIVQPSCFTAIAGRIEDREDVFLSQVNDLYCWREQDCEKYQFVECEQQEPIPIPIGDSTGMLERRENLIAENIVVESIHSSVETTTEDVPVEKTVSDKKEKKTDIEKPDAGKARAKTIGLPAASETTSSKRKPQVINSRMNKYRESVKVIIEKSKNNPLAAQVQSFLADPQPLYERLFKLATEILQNKVPKTKGGKALTKNQVYDLLQSSICYYLDKICFNGKEANKLNELKKLMEKLRKAGINIKTIYEYWNLPEVKKLEPGLPEETVQILFEAEKK